MQIPSCTSPTVVTKWCIVGCLSDALWDLGQTERNFAADVFRWSTLKKSNFTEYFPIGSIRQYISMGAVNDLAENLLRAMMTPSHEAYTVECRYNAVKYSKILHKLLQELGQNISQMLNPQKTPHSSPVRASFVNIWEKIDRVITTPHCISLPGSCKLKVENRLGKWIIWSHGGMCSVGDLELCGNLTRTELPQTREAYLSSVRPSDMKYIIVFFPILPKADAYKMRNHMG